MGKGSTHNKCLNVIKLASESHSENIRHQSFQVGNLLLTVRRQLSPHIENVISKWNGLYVLQEIYINGAYKLVDKDGSTTMPKICHTPNHMSLHCMLFNIKEKEKGKKKMLHCIFK